MERETYLEALEKQLRFFCSPGEREAILKDYTAAFDEGLSGGKSPGELCEAFGTPENAAKYLLTEQQGSFWKSWPGSLLLFMGIAVTIIFCVEQIWIVRLLAVSIWYYFWRHLPSKAVRMEGPSRAWRIAAILKDPVETLYLTSLAQKLRFHFSKKDQQEILLDYQEYFAAGKEDGCQPAELLARLGRPEMAVQALLKERTQKEIPWFRWAGFGMVLVWIFLSLNASHFNLLQTIDGKLGWLLFYGFPLGASWILLSLLPADACHAGEKTGKKTLLPLYIGTAFCTVISAGASASGIMGKWFLPAVFLGPFVAALLSCGAVFMLAASGLELFVFPGSRFALFFNLGVFAALTEFLQYLHNFNDQPGWSICIRAMLSVLTGLFFSWIWKKSHNTDPGNGSGISLSNETTRSRKERVEHIERVSRTIREAGI